MSRVLGFVVALSLGATGCGSGAGDGGEAADPSASPSPPASSAPQAPSEGVIEAGADLSDFVCQPDEDGVWNASGVITNSSGRSADYRVTVVVADGPGVSVPGIRRTLADLAPGTPKPFEIEALPSSGTADATCQVEVLRLP